MPAILCPPSDFVNFGKNNKYVFCNLGLLP
jgi:hypothetical protein